MRIEIDEVGAFHGNKKYITLELHPARGLDVDGREIEEKSSVLRIRHDELTCSIISVDSRKALLKFERSLEILTKIFPWSYEKVDCFLYVDWVNPEAHSMIGELARLKGKTREDLLFEMTSAFKKGLKGQRDLGKVSPKWQKVLADQARKQINQLAKSTEGKENAG